MICLTVVPKPYDGSLLYMITDLSLAEESFCNLFCRENIIHLNEDWLLVFCHCRRSNLVAKVKTMAMMKMNVFAPSPLVARHASFSSWLFRGSLFCCFVL